MCHCFSLVLIGLGLTIVDVQAQQNPIAPAKIGVVYHVQGDSLRELPRVTGKKKTATFITARSKLRMEFQGKTSNISIEDSNPTFTILLPSGDITKLSLYPLNLKGDKREAVVGTGGSLYGESVIGAQTLPLDSVKEGADVYRVTPASALKPGEYALAFAGSNEFFCFTVR